MKRVLLILCMGTVGCAGVPRAPVPPPKGSIGGYSATDCVEIVHVRPTPPDVAARLLPDGYRLALGPDGQAQVIFALYGCPAFAIDGRPAPGGVVAEHAVRIDAPDGSPGRHAYLLHLVTSVLPLAAALAPLSDGIELARDASLEVGHGSPGEKTVVRGRIRGDRFEAGWVGDPVVEPRDGPVDPDAKGVTFWLQTDAGRVQLDYSSRMRPRSTGTVTVVSGGVETSGQGAYLRFDPTVRVVR
ncbi:MAG: hypothetical protein WB493_16305 [Anaeromyxobacteraceae bacterium]